MSTTMTRPGGVSAVSEADVRVRAGFAMDRNRPARPGRYWHMSAIFATSATLVTAGGMSVAHTPHLVVGTTSCALAGAAATGVIARSDARRELNAALRASTERLTGPLRRWHTRRWNGGMIGTPQVIMLRYQPEAVIAMASWPAPLTKMLSDMLHTPYQVDKHDPGRGRLVLRRRDVTVEDVKKTRSERIMRCLFGDNTHVARKQSGSTEILTITYSNVIKAADPGWRETIERIVDTCMPGRWRARWDLLNDQVRFEVRPALPTLLKRRPPNLDPASKDFWRIPLGEDEDGAVVGWNLNSSMPHALVNGKTGKGKTNLLLGIGQELSVRQIATWACDPKRIELRSLRELPNVQVVATTPEDMAALVMCAYNEMERRYRLIETGKAKKGSFPRLVIMIDEYAEFVMRVQSWWASIKIPGMPTKCPVMDHFESLIRLCRAAQMNVVVGIQRPDVKFLPGEARANFDARVSLGPLDRDGSDMMWGSQIGRSTGLARGRAMACADDGEPSEIQTYWTPDRENDELDDETLELLDCFATDEVHPPLRISIPNPDQDDKGRDLWWDAIQDARMVIDDTPRIEQIAAQAEQDAEKTVVFGRPTLRVVENKMQDLAEDDSYGPAYPATLDQARLGDLYLRDDGSPDGTWVQVRGCEPDPLDPGLWDLAWEDETGQQGTDLLPDDTRITLRTLN